MKKSLALAGAVLLLGVSLTGCTVSAYATLSGDKAATLAEDALEKSVGQRPDVDCPDTLKLQAGESMRCTLVSPSTGTTYGLTVTVKDPATDGSGLSFKVDDTPAE